ncbi:MAG: DoxX family protein [Roseitalea porphyridii]|uniref:DoxX family protein n=1 Tax=Roseitalea porphyridii TaxID=1852022 RepID=UPI0032D973B9
MTDHGIASQRSDWKSYTLWAAQVLTAFAFFAAGMAKIAGAERMVTLFNEIGAGQWLRYTTGVLEMTGAILILIPSRAWLGGLLLSCIMVGAIYVHLAVVGGSFLPALVLLVLSAWIAYERRPAIRA